MNIFDLLNAPESSYTLAPGDEPTSCPKDSIDHVMECSSSDATLSVACSSSTGCSSNKSAQTISPEDPCISSISLRLQQPQPQFRRPWMNRHSASANPNNRISHVFMQTYTFDNETEMSWNDTQITDITQRRDVEVEEPVTDRNRFEKLRQLRKRRSTNPERLQEVLNNIQEGKYVFRDEIKSENAKQLSSPISTLNQVLPPTSILDESFERSEVLQNIVSSQLDLKEHKARRSSGALVFVPPLKSGPGSSKGPIPFSTAASVIPENGVFTSSPLDATLLDLAADPLLDCTWGHVSESLSYQFQDLLPSPPFKPPIVSYPEATNAASALMTMKHVEALQKEFSARLRLKYRKMNNRGVPVKVISKTMKPTQLAFQKKRVEALRKRMQTNRSWKSRKCPEEKYHEACEKSLYNSLLSISFPGRRTIDVQEDDYDEHGFDVTQRESHEFSFGNPSVVYDAYVTDAMDIHEDAASNIDVKMDITDTSLLDNSYSYASSKPGTYEAQGRRKRGNAVFEDKMKAMDDLKTAYDIDPIVEDTKLVAQMVSKKVGQLVLEIQTSNQALMYEKRELARLEAREAKLLRLYSLGQRITSKYIRPSYPYQQSNGRSHSNLNNISSHTWTPPKIGLDTERRDQLPPKVTPSAVQMKTYQPFLRSPTVESIKLGRLKVAGVGDDPAKSLTPPVPPKPIQEQPIQRYVVNVSPREHFITKQPPCPVIPPCPVSVNPAIPRKSQALTMKPKPNQIALSKITRPQPSNSINPIIPDMGPYIPPAFYKSAGSHVHHSAQGNGKARLIKFCFNKGKPPITLNIISQENTLRAPSPPEMMVKDCKLLFENKSAEMGKCDSTGHDPLQGGRNNNDSVLPLSTVCSPKRGKKKKPEIILLD